MLHANDAAVIKRGVIMAMIYPKLDFPVITEDIGLGSICYETVVTRPVGEIVAKVYNVKKISSSSGRDCR